MLCLLKKWLPLGLLLTEVKGEIGRLEIEEELLQLQIEEIVYERDILKRRYGAGAR